MCSANQTLFMGRSCAVIFGRDALHAVISIVLNFSEILDTTGLRELGYLPIEDSVEYRAKVCTPRRPQQTGDRTLMTCQMPTQDPYRQKKKNMRIRQLKLVSPIVLCVITVACVSLLAWLNIKHFEKTIITQTQQNLLTITQTEAMHLENVFSNIQSKLEILALNPTVQKRTRQNIGTSEVSADGYNPLKDFFKHSEDTIDSVYRRLQKWQKRPGC